MIVHDAPDWVAQTIACSYGRGAAWAFVCSTPNAFYFDAETALLASWKLYAKWAKWSGAYDDTLCETVDL